MRISTSMLFDGATSRISELQSASSKIQEQIASGKKLLSPADDPIAAVGVIQVGQAKSLNDQFTANRAVASSDLTTVESVLASVTSGMQDMRVLTVTAGSAALSQQDRGYLATELEGHLQDFIGLANTQDSFGNYLFSGYQSATPAFSKTAGGATFNGDTGVRQLQVGNAQTIPVSVAGSTIFEQVKTGNGTFQVSALPGNTGAGVFSTGVVKDPTAITQDTFSVDFSVAAGVTTYALKNTTTGATISSGNTYASGDEIVVSGMSFSVKGVPANGDAFVLQPSKTESIFTTVQNLITALRNPTTGAASNAQLDNALAKANQQLSTGLDNVLSVRAGVGANLKALSTLDDAGSATDLQYQETLRGLQDVDYVKAISDLTKQQTMLQAAQQSFVKISGLSLFDYLK